ncbi:serine protease [Aliikangiella marina]|nr:serine protease [Aliikangiella marina]
MKLKKINRLLSQLFFTAAVAGSYANSLAANPATIPFYKTQYTFESGVVSGKSLSLMSKRLTHTVSFPDAPWLKLNLEGTELGQNSYLELTSKQDGAKQIINAQTLAQWNYQTAFFNGGSVHIKLVVDPNDTNVELKVSEVTVGEKTQKPSPLSICGVDNRIASTEPRVARIDPIGCTAWIIDGGQILTAGHCLAGSGNTTLSFNPPASLPDGTVQFPGPEDQYSINQSSFDYRNGGVGNDWGVLSAFNNAQTGLQPIEAQGSFSIKQDLNPANIRITGFGVDSGSTNQTNQTHVGANAGSSGTTMRYTADTTGGNSGSPIIDEATGEAVGIHSHGGCSSSGGNNNGTSFFNTALWNAIDTGGTPPPPPPVTELENNVPVTNLSATQGNDVNYTMEVPAGASDISFQISGGSGDADLYVRFGAAPTDSTYDCRPYRNGNSESCTGTDTGGTYYVRVKAYSTFSGVSLVGSYSDGNPPPPPACDVQESFESGLGGWTTGGSCSTGTFISGSPTEVVNGGVTTQVGGAQNGSNALFTQPNSSAGRDDVDGGECTATSPVYSVSSTSDVSLHYFHGQRDAGDDSGDGFNLEVSLNGGSYASLVSIGDVTSNAVWTQESFTANTGDTVQFRVRVADAAGAGDLIEAGIDNLQICRQ